MGHLTAPGEEQPRRCSGAYQRPEPGELLTPFSSPGGQYQQVTAHSPIQPSPRWRSRGGMGKGEVARVFILSPLSCSDRVVPAADSSELKHENTASPLACFLYTVFPCPHPRGGMQGAQTIPTKLGGTVDTQGRAEGKELPSEVEGTREPRAGSAPPCAYRSMGWSLPSWVPQRI